jgi:hypothetical protein
MTEKICSGILTICLLIAMIGLFVYPIAKAHNWMWVMVVMYYSIPIGMVAFAVMTSAAMNSFERHCNVAIDKSKQPTYDHGTSYQLIGDTTSIDPYFVGFPEDCEA